MAQHCLELYYMIYIFLNPEHINTRPKIQRDILGNLRTHFRYCIHCCLDCMILCKPYFKRKLLYHRFVSQMVYGNPIFIQKLYALRTSRPLISRVSCWTQAIALDEEIGPLSWDAVDELIQTAILSKTKSIKYFFTSKKRMCILNDLWFILHHIRPWFLIIVWLYISWKRIIKHETEIRKVLV